MTEQERVKALLAEGKISQEEADLLLSALEDIDKAETAVDDVAQEVSKQAAVGESSDNAEASDMPFAAAKAPDPAAVKTPQGLSWVRINVLAGDLSIRLDPSLTAPAVDGKATIRKQGNDYLIAYERAEDKSLAGLITGFMRRMDDLNVRIPPGYGVELKSKAGDVDIDGVPYLKGNLLAGDINATNLGGIDLSMSAGDLDVGLLLSEGEHRVQLTAGDVDIKLLKGSSVKITADVNIGDLDFKGPAELKESLQTKRRMMGGHVEATLGEAAASLEVQLRTGDLQLEVESD